MIIYQYNHKDENGDYNQVSPNCRKRNDQKYLKKYPENLYLFIKDFYDMSIIEDFKLS